MDFQNSFKRFAECQDLEVDNMLEWAQSGNYVWFYMKSNDHMKFTKVLSDPKNHIKYADYFYECTLVDGGLKVHINYSPGFTDVMGPPDRFYRQIELNN